MSFDIKKIVNEVKNLKVDKIISGIKDFKFDKLVSEVKKLKFNWRNITKKELNIGGLDKKIRIGVGAFLILLALAKAKILILLLGIGLVATGYSGWCPGYSAFGKSTNSAGGSK